MQSNVTTETLQAIGRLRRAQPRNPDTMLVCDELERALTFPLKVAEVDVKDIVLKPGAITVIPNKKCPVCEARKSADRARVQKHRKLRAVDVRPQG
jgi:hypothetical protein